MSEPSGGATLERRKKAVQNLNTESAHLAAPASAAATAERTREKVAPLVASWLRLALQPPPPLEQQRVRRRRRRQTTRPTERATDLRCASAQVNGATSALREPTRAPLQCALAGARCCGASHPLGARRSFGRRPDSDLEQSTYGFGRRCDDGDGGAESGIQLRLRRRRSARKRPQKRKRARASDIITIYRLSAACRFGRARG